MKPIGHITFVPQLNINLFYIALCLEQITYFIKRNKLYITVQGDHYKYFICVLFTVWHIKYYCQLANRLMINIRCIKFTLQFQYNLILAYE